MFMFLSLAIFSTFLPHGKVFADMPFYDLQPKDIVLKSSFYTSYYNSSDERKSNIKLSAKKLNNTFVDVGAEFSFNDVVGERSEKNGYKIAKVIVNGRFEEGLGGGVCQVSTTLYNAALLAGLKITEYHPHSLPVSYVAPSFDAMVNSGSADLRFINNTHNPVIIKAYADDNRIKIEIMGEKNGFTIERQSEIVEEIIAPEEITVIDEKGEYSELKKGERKVITYSKNGLVSKGIIIKRVNGKVVSKRTLRVDRYKPQTGIIVVGK